MHTQKNTEERKSNERLFDVVHRCIQGNLKKLFEVSLEHTLQKRRKPRTFTNGSCSPWCVEIYITKANQKRSASHFTADMFPNYPFDLFSNLVILKNSKLLPSPRKCKKNIRKSAANAITSTQFFRTIFEYPNGSAYLTWSSIAYIRSHLFVLIHVPKDAVAYVVGEASEVLVLAFLVHEAALRAILPLVLASNCSMYQSKTIRSRTGWTFVQCNIFTPRKRLLVRGSKLIQPEYANLCVKMGTIVRLVLLLLTERNTPNSQHTRSWAVAYCKSKHLLGPGRLIEINSVP